MKNTLLKKTRIIPGGLSGIPTMKAVTIDIMLRIRKM